MKTLLMLLVCTLMMMSSCTMNKRIKTYPHHSKGIRYSKATDKKLFYNPQNDRYYFKW